MSRKSKRILLTLASAAVGAACGAAVYFIRKGKADLETDFDDFKDEFEEEEPAPAERTYTTLPDSESTCEAPEAESGDDEADSCEEETTEETAGAAEETLSAADREVSPQEESEVTAE